MQQSQHDVEFKNYPKVESCHLQSQYYNRYKQVVAPQILNYQNPKTAEKGNGKKIFS